VLLVVFNKRKYGCFKQTLRAAEKNRRVCVIGKKKDAVTAFSSAETRNSKTRIGMFG